MFIFDTLCPCYKRLPLELFRSGLEDHVWTVPKVVLKQKCYRTLWNRVVLYPLQEESRVSDMYDIKQRKREVHFTQKRFLTITPSF